MASPLMTRRHSTSIEKRRKFFQKRNAPVSARVPAETGVDKSSILPANARSKPLNTETVVIIERVEPDSPAERAGLQAGDTLQTCTGKAISSPLTLLAYEENTLPDAAVTLQAERDGHPHEISLSIRPQWGITARPPFSDGVLEPYRQGSEAFAQERYTEAYQHWNTAAQLPQPPIHAAWLAFQAGIAAEKDPLHTQQANKCYTQAAQWAKGNADATALLSASWMALGRIALEQNNFKTAVKWLKKAVKEDRRANRLMWSGRGHRLLSDAAFRQWLLEEAKIQCERAFDLVSRFGSDTFDAAICRHGLGLIAARQGDLSSAGDHLRAALALYQTHAPASLEEAKTLNGLGIVFAEWGNFRAAHNYFFRALPLFERLAPASRFVPMVQMNIGNIAQSFAWDHLSRDARYFEWLDEAESYYARALERFEAIEADSLDISAIFNNRGVVAHLRDDLDHAEEYHARSLAIKNRLIPGTLEAARSLTGLGDAAYERSLQGETAEHQRQLQVAHDYHLQSAAIRRNLAPGSPDYAESLEDLGQVALRKGLPDAAKAFFEEAAAIVESQRERLAAPEQRALLMAQHTRKYAGLIQSHHLLGNDAVAFLTLERARARSFIELLAEREIDFAEGMPPELVLQQQELEQRTAEIYEHLSTLTAASDEDARTELHRQLHTLDEQKAALIAEIRAASPKYAELQYPQPLTFEEAKQLLEPGTLLLAYFVDDVQTFLFSVTAQSLHIETLPIGRNEIKKRVAAFRTALHPNTLNGETEAVAQGRELYQLLLASAHTEIQNADRLLLCADGAMHTLPFAALITDNEDPPRYLGSAKPIHMVLSMTVYGQIAKPSATPMPHEPSARPLFALGDPLYEAENTAAPADPQDDSSTRSAEAAEPDPLDAAEPTLRGKGWKSLPHTRQEVIQLGTLFSKATLRLGAEATKTTALAECPHAEILHFACHGVFDPSVPLCSGLVLSQPNALGANALDGDNGMLQSWEVFQSLKLRADLVTLSACKTGLGQEVQGEGLIGLTRAFQYAGAKSVLVSLWDIADASTALFMQAFYSALHNRHSKDEALRHAIQILQQDTRYRRPYFWSAFVLTGSRH